MKKIGFLLVGFLLTFSLTGQISTKFIEDFETIPLSVSSSGSASWARSNTLFASGMYSDSARIINTGDSAILTTNSFSTTGYSYVRLSFDQICKIEFFDKGYVEVSTNNGSSWTTLTASEYLSNGNFATNSNAFNSVSYPTDWQASNNSIVPDNSWWKSESFELSALAANSSQVKIRFRLKDANNSGGGGAYGWLLDNIKIVGSASEITPPIISMVSPIIQDTLYTTGPFVIKAELTDTSGIDTALVIYTIGSVTDSLPMVFMGNNTYQASIPQQSYNTTVSYYVKAYDNSSNHNVAIGNTYNFYNKQPQKVVHIGTGTSGTYYAPFYNYTTTSADVYSDHMAIYTATEMQGNYGLINKIVYEKNNSVNYTGTASVQIFLKETSDNTASTSASDFQTALNGATLVYEDTALTFPAATGLVEFVTNQNTFNYSGSNNLMVLVRWHRSGTLSANYLRWNYTYSSGEAVTFKGSTANPTSAVGSGYKPNLYFWLSDPATTYDAGIASFESPDSVVLSSSAQPVKVKVKNYGSANLSKVNVHYQLDGTTQPTTAWTGNTPQFFTTSEINLGSHTFSVGAHHIKAWTSLPNDSVDELNLNDTLTLDFYACTTILSGSYTVGGTAADFADFDEVSNTLSHCGVNAPVTFYVNSGTYDELIDLSAPIPGLDSVNTITFTSATGTASDVIVKYTGNTGTSLVDIQGNGHINFKNMTLDGSNSNISKTISCQNSAHHITFDSCHIMADPDASYGVYSLYLYGQTVHDITITNSKIQGGYYGVYIYGNYSQHSEYFTLNNNEVTGFSSRGVYGYYTDFVEVHNNQVISLLDPNSSTLAGIYFYRVEEYNLTGNYIYLEPNSSTYGLYLSYSANATGYNLVANNMVINYNPNSTSTSFRALYLSSVSSTKVYHNTFVNYGGQSVSEAAYASGSCTNLELKNNIIAHMTGGYALEKYTSASFSALDNNLYYTSGGQIMKYGSTVIAKASGISGIQSATGMDSNSVIGDPKFYSIQNAHSYSTTADGTAQWMPQVLTDIDGDVRSTTTPDIGADEFAISSLDIGITSIIDPLPTDTEARIVPVKAVMTNFGSDTLTSATVKYVLGSASPVSYSWNGSLAGGESDTLTLPALTLPATDVTLKVFTVKSGDTLTYNDTTSLNINVLGLFDAQLVSIDNPTDGCGKDTAEIVTITVRNNGVGNIISGLTASYRVNGGVVITENITDTVNAGATINYDFTHKVNMQVGSADSNFVFDVWVNKQGDAVSTNDSLSKTVVSQAFLVPPVVSDTTINYGDSVSLHAASTYSVQWFGDDTTSSVLNSGNYYTTPMLFDTTTYYVRANTNIPAQTAYLGTSSNTYGMWDYPPYGGGMGSGKYQLLFLASELHAQGLSAGNIESIAFDVATAPNQIQLFKLYIGTTNAISLGSTFISSTMTQVWSGGFTGQAGWNTHTFSTPFYWDGQSNIVLQVCADGIGYTAPPQKYTTTSFNSYAYVAGVGTSCSTTSSLTSVKRPNTRFKTQGALGCSSPRVPLTVNVPLPDYDGEMAEVTGPVSGCGLASASVSVDIVNKGTHTIPAGFAATYRVNNGTYVAPETVGDSIISGDTINYTFNTAALLPPGSNGTNYAIHAKIMVPNDSYHPNDSIASDSIFSKYTPANPVVSNMSVLYGQSATLTATANDTVYWFTDSLGNNLLGTGSPFVTTPLYDTTTFWAGARKTIAQTNYDVGNGTSVAGYSDPSPYGASGYGAKHQFLIRASELTAMGMMKGYIDSLGFDVANVKGIPLNNYTIRIGNTTANDLNISSFITGLTTVYNSAAYTEHVGWNMHSLSQPFYWDGASNVVIETVFKNTSSAQNVGAKYTVTPFVSTAQTKGYSTFDPNATSVNNHFSKRPNIRLIQTGYGECGSDILPLTVTVTNIPGADAALIALIPDANASSASGSPVKAILKNYGTNTMTSATIHWTENGSLQSAYNWSGNLTNGQQDTITIAANHVFEGGVTELKAWVSLAGDTIAANDTTMMNHNVCMSGTYYVGASHYIQTPQQAVYHLNQSGVCGPVVLAIDSGYYVGQLLINPITGTNAVNTITFTSSAGDSSHVIISETTTQVSNYVVNINGASFITFNKVSVFANGSNYSNVIVLNNNASHITISNSELTSGNATSGYASNLYAYQTKVSDISLINNKINGGYRSIYIYSASANHSERIVIEDNLIDNINYYGTYFYYIDSLIVRNNRLVSSPGASNNYGIYGYYIDYSRIENNRIELSTTNSTYGLYYRTDGTSSQRSLIANNFISIGGGAGTKYGMYLNNNSYTDAVYNSVNIYAGSASSRALNCYNGSHLKLVNNNYSAKAGYALYVTSPNAFTQFDYNNIYVDTNSTTNYAYWGGGNVADLANLKLQDLTKNIHSLDVDPLYFSFVDLHAQQIAIYNAGTPFSVVSLDIDGETRSTTSPSIGADEFTPPAIDLGLVSIPYPNHGDCGYTSSDSVVVKMKNYGLNNLNFSSSNATITLIITGINPDTITKVISSGTLASGAETLVVVTNNYDMSANGVYNFTASVSISSDGNSQNDIANASNIISYPNISTFPFFEGFESGNNLSLKEEDNPQSSLTVDAVSASAGSYGLHFEGGSYTGWYTPNNVNAAFANTDHVAKAMTCNVDASSVSALSLKFDLKQTAYSSYYLNKNSWFRVRLFDVNGVHYLTDQNGDSVFQPLTVNSDPFVTHIYNLNNWAGQSFSILLEAVNKYNYGYGSNDGDNAFVDNVMIWSPTNVDAAAMGIFTEVNYGPIGQNKTIKIAVQNTGTDTITTLPVGYQITGSTAVLDTFTTVLAPNETDTFTFATPLLLPLGMNNLLGFVKVANDNVVSNDTTISQIMGMPTLSIDFYDDFENQNNWFENGIQNQWELGTPAKTHINAAHSGTKAWVTKLSGNYSANSTDEYLYSPYITISANADTATLNFWQMMRVPSGQAWGSIEYSVNGGIWSSIGYMGAPNSVNWYNFVTNGKHVWSLLNNQWINSSIKLDPSVFNTGQPIQFRFAFHAGLSTNTNEGWAIDDFKVFVPSVQLDAGVTNIISPVTQTSAGDTLTVEVVIKNFGTDTLMTIPVQFTLSGNAYNETWSGTLLPDSSVNYTFNTQAVMPAAGSYQFCAKTMLANDGKPGNDMFCHGLAINPATLDAGVSKLVSPSGQTTIGGNIDVMITIQNYGTDTLTSIPVSYLAGTSVANETWTGTLLPGDSVDYTFTNTYTSPAGNYNVCAFTKLNGDMVSSNDQSCVTVIGTSIMETLKNGFMVSQNEPNPARGVTRVVYQTPYGGKVHFTLIDVTGALIDSRIMETPAGKHQLLIPAGTLQPGIYYYTMEFDGYRITHKMIVT